MGKLEKYAVVSYLCIAVMVFGHAFNDIYDSTPRNGIIAPAERATYGAISCAVAWPLYVSAQIWKQLK